MKMIMCIVDDMDAYSLIEGLTKRTIQVTKLTSSGGFLKKGNTTLLIGLEDSQVREVVELVKSMCHPRNEIVSVEPMALPGEAVIPFSFNVKIGGATIFVLDVEKYEKV
jgi:uncharacterized protein YaaQ